LAPARSDIAADAPITLEPALGVEDRLAAHAGIFQLAVGTKPAKLQVVKRLMRLEQRTVRRPIGLGHVERGQVQARLADVALRPAAFRGLGSMRHLDKSEILVLLPEPVRGQPGQAAEALFAFSHFLFGLLALHELAELGAYDSNGPQQ